MYLYGDFFKEIQKHWNSSLDLKRNRENLIKKYFNCSKIENEWQEENQDWCEDALEKIRKEAVNDYKKVELGWKLTYF